KSKPSHPNCRVCPVQSGQGRARQSRKSFGATTATRGSAGGKAAHSSRVQNRRVRDPTTAVVTVLNNAMHTDSAGTPGFHAKCNGAEPVMASVRLTRTTTRHDVQR